MKMIIMLFICGISFAQNDSIPGILETDLPECRIMRNQVFDGNSLWGYINGGADVYLEYGFTKLLVQNLEVNGNDFTVNVYKMNSPEAAFGIFSINKHKCTFVDSAFVFSCITRYQFQFFAAQFYISIINKNGTESEQKLCSKIALTLLNRIKVVTPEYPDIFMNDMFMQHLNDLRYFNGMLGLQNGYPDWIDMFEENSEFSLYLLPIEDSYGYINIAHIRFKSPVNLTSFITKMKFENNKIIVDLDKKYYFRKVDENTGIFYISNKNIKEFKEMIFFLNHLNNARK